MKRFVVVIVMMMLVGCVSNQKYYRITNPLNNTVVIQVQTPTPEACRFIINNAEKEAKPYLSCSADSVSHALPYRATVRNKAISQLFDIEAITYPVCLETVQELENSKHKDNVELVSKCAMK